jgi:CubicO group peptidase (beta-lactamase class C family)
MAAATFVLAASGGCAAAPEPGRTVRGPSAEVSAPPPVRNAEFEQAISQLAASPYAPPGFAVLVVEGDRTVFERAYGTRNLATGTPLTLDTPIYNASSTKAYTGLLAAVLDHKGVLPATASLKDVWPDLALRPPLDASTITAGALLSHSSGIHEGGIQFRSNTTGQITSAEVPGLLGAYAVARPPGFAYQNFGPFVWSAMAETRTGVSLARPDQAGGFHASRAWPHDDARRGFRP